MDEVAIPIPLRSWQDPQGDIVLKFARQECPIYFGGWMCPGEPADYIGELTFEHAWAVRGYCSEYLPYSIKGKIHRSSIFEIQNSTWLSQESQQRARGYPDWHNWDKRTFHHYVVQGHDNYYEILASGFIEKSIPYDEAGELKRLIDEA